LESPPSLALPGYEVERLIARGGFGTLLAARRASDGQVVAVKLAHAGHTLAEEQLQHEARALRAIGPPTVPELYEAGTLESGQRYLVMELVALPTLAERMAQRSGPMPLPEVGPRALAIAQALEAVHAQGLAHCDLKPEHVFLDDAAGRVRLFDFGLVRQAPVRPPGSASLTVSTITSPGNSFAGTAEYMAPEQCSGATRVDARADVYAFGAMLYEALTGRPPFFGSTAEILHAHLALRPPPPSELAPVPPALEEVVLRCLAKERSRRYESVTLLRTALQDALARSQQATPTPRPQQPAEEGARATHGRRSVAVLFFLSGANPLVVQKALTSFGGQLAHHEGARFAGVFDPDGGENPVRRAMRAAEGLAERELAPAALVDVAAVTVQRRPGAPPRYLGAIFSRKDRYPPESSARLLYATAAAAEAVPESRYTPVPGMEGVLRLVPPGATPLAEVTVLRLGSEVLVGRDEELASLVQDAQTTLERGSPSIVTVLGERGVGKSHFSATLAIKLQEAMPWARVFAARAKEPVQGDPEGTLRALLRCAINAFDGDETGSEAECRAAFFDRVNTQEAVELWPGVAATLGWYAPGSPELQSAAAAPGALRALSMRATGELLSATARAQPLCIILDDAHFAEETALDALEYACLAEARTPVWLCVLARPDFEKLRPSWGARAARSHTVHLGPLAPPHASELCRNLLRPADSIPAQAVERIVERTQRVPLFLVELARGIKRQGLVRPRASGGTWYLATDELDKLPELRLVEWLADRELGALPPALAAHARLCALLGSDFTAAAAEGVVRELELEGAAGGFPLDPRHATHRLLDSGLLVAHRQDALSFRNELVREAVASNLPAPERARIHHAAYRYYLSQAGAGERQRLPRLALHAAKAGLREEAAALYIDLAEAARGRHSYLDAETMYSRALEMLDPNDAPRCLTALRGRGLMRYRIGRYEDSLADFVQAREQARRTGNVHAEVELLLDEAMALDWVSDYVHSEERVVEAQGLAHRVESPYVQARLLLGLGRAQLRRGEWLEACPPLEAAAARARRLGDSGYETEVVAQLILAGILPHLGRTDEAQRVFDEVINTCAEHGDRFHLGVVLNNRRNLWVALKNMANAARDLERFIQLGRELGLLVWEYIAEYNLGELHYLAGDVPAAAPHIARALELERRYPDVAPRPWARLTHARALAYTGEVQRARAMLEEIRGVLADSPEGSNELSPSEQVLFDMVELSIRRAPLEEWRALQARSEQYSMEQEPLEVLDMMALNAVRRGETAEAAHIQEAALQRATQIPNLMEGRMRRTLEKALSPAA
jgi:tetratricopeptide (TPR) repeat protein